MRRFREAVTETAGFYNTAGFVDDTRAFASIPARHDLARRVDAGYLARLVAEGHLDLDEASDTAVDLAHAVPRAVYAPPAARGLRPGS
jgi:glucuronate isomerase